MSRFKFGRICISEILINSAECKIIVELLVKKYRDRSPSGKIIKSRKTRREDLYEKNYTANYIGIWECGQKPGQIQGSERSRNMYSKEQRTEALSGELSDICIDSRCFNGLQIRIGVDY